MPNSFSRLAPSPARLALGALLLSTIAPLTGCRDRAANQRGPAPAPVVVATVERKPAPLVLDAVGTVEPSRTASVRSQVTGTILRIVFQEGQQVGPGDPLFEIDPRPFKNALLSAEADLRKNQVALENARAQLARYRALDATAVVSKEEFQSVEDTERSATAQVLAGEAAVATAKLQLDYCSIRSPIAGTAGSYGAHEGDLIGANASAPLVVVNQISPTYVTFGVPQQYLADLQRYRAAGPVVVEATPPGSDSTPERGELTFIDNTVDSATGTIRLKATFANASRRLWPGQFAVVQVVLATPDALVVPTAAIQNSQNGQHVFVIKSGNIAEMRPVVVERRSGEDTVIAQGLSAGETIITDGQLRVVSGRPVEIKPRASAPPAGSATAPAPSAPSPTTP